MTDLETAIRDALHARVDGLEPREVSLRSRPRRRWLPPAIAAALVIALVAITVVLLQRKDTTAPPASTQSASFVGYRWRLAQIDDRQGRLVLPATAKASVSFERGGRMVGGDTVNELNARYRLVAGGYQPAEPSTTATGFAGRISGALKRTIFAVGTCFSSVRGGGKPPTELPVRATVHGDRLILHTSDGVLTFVRAGAAA